MAEKHLTEKLWKDLVAKQGVKDLGLQKALAAYAKVDAAKEPAQSLEALKEISDLALKLKKTCAAKADVVDHLDEMVKEVKKTTPALEAKVKAAETAAEAAEKAAAKPAEDEEEEAEEEEAEEFKKDLKKQMVSALAQVKMRAPGDPEQEKEPKPQLKFMAYLAGKGCAVVVARKVGSATKKLLPDIAGGATGGKFCQGECIFEKNAHTFVLDTVPGGLAKRLAAALHAETGVKYKVRARSTDGATVLDSDTDVDPEAAAAPATATAPPAAPPAPAPAANAEQMAAFTARFKALQPDILKAAATKTPQGDAIKQRAAEAGALAGKNDFEQANRRLDEVKALLAQIPAAVPAPDPTAPQGAKLSTYLTGRANLRAARENAEKELKRLQAAILAKAADEPFLKEIETKSQKLFEDLAPIDDAVANKLDDAGRCTDPEDQANKNLEVRKLIQKQLASVRGHPLAAFVEKNPFGKFGIKQPLEVTLSALDKQLS